MRNRFADIISILCCFFGLTLSAVSAEPLPRPLSDKDAETYRQIFALQEDGDIKAAAKLIKTLDSDLLMGHVLSQKYLHPTAGGQVSKNCRTGWLIIMIIPPPAGSNGCQINASPKRREPPKPRNLAI